MTPGPMRLAEAAEGLVDELEVHRPFGHGLGLDGRPGVGVAGRVAGEEVVEGAR